MLKRDTDLEYNGLFCIDKKCGDTSFDTVRILKKRIGKSKAGHTGTLDKFASGLLLVLAGNCTKLNPLFLRLDKDYRAKILLGKETDTLDPEGSVIAEGTVPTIEAIEAVLPGFTGEIKQIPPAYSALHIHGERAHTKARRGDNFEVPERTIRIDSITIIEFDPPFLTLDVTCSSGTYIRSLARDIGKACGTCAYLDGLTRTRIGSFSLERARKADNIVPETDIVRPFDFIDKLYGVSKRTVKREFIRNIQHGGELKDEFVMETMNPGSFFALFDDEKELHAIVRKDDAGEYSYFAVMSSAGVQP